MPASEPEQPEPTFHEFASEWLATRRHDLRPNTVLDYEWQLSSHLLPYFARHRLSEITIAEVDRYRTSKVAEGVLSPASINKTIARLGQILEVAMEYGHIASNPARGRRRMLKTRSPQRGWLEIEQVRALLEAAGKHRPIIATLVFAGLRVSELTGLLWRDVDLAQGRLHVRESKTEAGHRVVDDLSPSLVDELSALKAHTAFSGPNDFVFATTARTRMNRNNLRIRVVKSAIARANERIAEEGGTQIPEHVTTHSLRRTYISMLLELGKPVPYVMAQVGHTDPKVTLSIYATKLKRQRNTGAELDALIHHDGGLRVSTSDEPTKR